MTAENASVVALFEGEVASIVWAKMYMTRNGPKILPHLAKRDLDRDVRHFSFVKKASLQVRF
jgi:hypothetical protein